MSIFTRFLKREETQNVEVTDENTSEANNDSPQDLLLKSLLRGEKLMKMV